jgi:hypothetical protein
MPPWQLEDGEEHLNITQSSELTNELPRVRGRGARSTSHLHLATMDG